jgi:succinoglycan biosynthesis transport protein ExoP
MTTPQEQLVPFSIEGQQTPNLAASLQYDTLVRIVRRNRWLMAMVVALSLAAGVGYLKITKPQYTSTAQLYVELSSPKLLKNQDQGEKARSNLFMQESVLKSTPVLEEVIVLAGQADCPAQLQPLLDMPNPLSYLQSNTTTSVGKKNDIISVSFTCGNPEESAVTTNAIVDCYVQYQSGKMRSTAGELLGILQAEKERYDKDMSEKLRQLTEFKKDNKDIVFVSGKGDAAAERLAKLSEALTQSQLDTMQSKVVYESIKTMSESPSQLREYVKARKLQGAVSLENEESSILRNKLNNMQLGLDKLLRVLTPEHPSVKAMEDKIATTFAQLEQIEKEYVQSQLVMSQQQYVVAQEKERQIQEQYEQQRKLALEVNEKYSDYMLLESQWQQTKKMCDLLDDRIKEVNVTENAGAMDIRILEKAVATLAPSWPDKSRVLTMALLVGLMIAAVVSIVRDFFDARFGSEREIYEVLGCPVLGLVPQIRAIAGSGRFLYTNGYASLGHIFRKICAILLCQMESDRKRILHICSGQDREGKSFTALHLAMGMAQSGQRTLLLDCCCRNGVLKDQLGIFCAVGIYEILNKSCSIPTAITRTGIENLDYLSCGQVTGNPIQVFHHEKFRTILKLLACQYDRILMDSGSYLSCPESLALSALADGVIYVLDGERSNQAYAVQIRKELGNLGVMLLGAIVNKVRTHGSAFVYSPMWFGEPATYSNPTPEPATRVQPNTHSQEKLYI